MLKSQDSELTAFENVVIGVHTHRQETVFNNILVTWSLTINMPVIISNRTDCLFRTVGILAALLYHDYMGIGTRNPVFGICDQQIRRPACACAQIDWRLCYSLHVKFQFSC